MHGLMNLKVQVTTRNFLKHQYILCVFVYLENNKS